MRSFFKDHWKAIVVIVLLVVLASFTETPGAAPLAPTLAQRLHAHARALAADPRDGGARYIDAMLRADGYAVRSMAGAGNGQHGDELEASTSNVARVDGKAARPVRVFVIGARRDAGGVAAVLELARLLKDLRPGPGTELRFVFFADAPAADMMGAGGDGAGSFIAFAGTLDAARSVQGALAAFQAAAGPPTHGLAAPDYAQGVTLSSHAACDRSGYPALMVTGTAFGRYPYYQAEDDTGDSADDDDYAGAARVLNGLARTLAALAGAQQG